MAAGEDVIDLREGGDLFEMGEAAAVNDGHADVVDQLLGDEKVRVPNGVEDFADSERRGGVLADDAETFLEFGGDGVFEPEEMIRLETFAKARRFDGSEAVMCVVKQVNVVAEFQAKGFEELWDMQQIFFGGPDIFRRQAFFGGLVIELVFRDAVG